MVLMKTTPDVQIIVKDREFINMTRGRVEIVDRPDLEQIMPVVLELCLQASKALKIKLLQRQRDVERVKNGQTTKGVIQ